MKLGSIAVLLIEGVLNGMRLNYSGNEFECNDEKITAALKLIVPDKCESRISKLKKEKAQHDAEIEELRKRKNL